MDGRPAIGWFRDSPQGGPAVQVSYRLSAPSQSNRSRREGLERDLKTHGADRGSERNCHREGWQTKRSGILIMGSHRQHLRSSSANVLGSPVSRETSFLEMFKIFEFSSPRLIIYRTNGQRPRRKLVQWTRKYPHFSESQSIYKMKMIPVHRLPWRFDNMIHAKLLLHMIGMQLRPQ